MKFTRRFSGHMKTTSAQKSPETVAEIPRLKMEFHIRTFQRTRRVVRVIAVVLVSMVTSFAGPSLGLQTDLVSDQSKPGGFPMATGKLAAPIFLDPADW